jgi:uncharacterized OsmC-like protein
MHAHTILATRISGVLGEARAREVVVPIETTVVGREDAMSPLELLLAAVAGGVLAGVEQAAATLSFHLGGASVEVRGVCTGHATTLAVEYDLSVETDETDGRLVQFHELVRHAEGLLRLGALGAHLTGRVRRRATAMAAAPAARSESAPPDGRGDGASPPARSSGGESAAAAAASPRR